MSKRRNLGKVTVRVRLHEATGAVDIEHDTKFSPQLTEMLASLSSSETQIANEMRRAGYKSIADFMLFVNDPDRPMKVGGDLETPSDFVQRLARQNLKALLCINALKAVACEVLSEWDGDNDLRVGKLLLALAGRNAGYRADIDEVHDFVAAIKAHPTGLPPLNVERKL